MSKTDMGGDVPVAVLATRLEVLEVSFRDGMVEIKTSIAALTESILGNDREGLTTRVSRTSDSVRRLWWFTGLVSGACLAAILGVAVKIVFFNNP